MKAKNILYVTTHLTGTWRYFSWCAYPNIWYSRVQTKVLQLLSQDKVNNIYIKFYPNDFADNPNHILVKQFSNIKVLNQGLLDILSATSYDVIITESSATTLLEMLCTTSQIISFIPEDFKRFSPVAIELLGKRVILCQDKAAYYSAIERFLIDNWAIKQEINDEFLLKFGLFSITAQPPLLNKLAIDEILNKS